MAYCNDYSWSRKFNNDRKMTRWFSVLMFVACCGNEGASKREIIQAIWNKEPEDFTCYDMWNRKFNSTFRGWNTKLFACMNEDNIINYNPHTKRWYLGSKGQQITYDYFIEKTNEID